MQPYVVVNENGRGVVVRVVGLSFRRHIIGLAVAWKPKPRAVG